MYVRGMHQYNAIDDSLDANETAQEKPMFEQFPLVQLLGTGKAKTDPPG